MAEKGKLVLVTGGASSGKSRFAEELAARLAQEVVYIATARITDEEMARRVGKHKARRPASWRTVEEPWDLKRALQEWGQASRTILVDCLGTYVTNLLVDKGMEEEEVSLTLQDFARLAWASPADVIIVSNEVGWGVVPSYPLGRVFRDLLGAANQEIACLADEVYLVVSGLPLEIKSLAQAGLKNFSKEEASLDGRLPCDTLLLGGKKK
ncbi:adenosylcobinamide kinase /adenosylcobinamide-phosphate guanylyltransferase [Thermanaeromonas toyohensis ToBE]|uniref:Adenosylcobinamide kinase n=1 Tax=Thermanaeromonas toyohensis ToBE TaxID=698762 RepID=A0A1W1VVF0_9FIRM|nr:bifunctional adenosylcobinamide kinase/adenosylcobinamide-phosphate guanylyltransferase [Thermanaeromonas toyohensis]SMB97306.1 adenosylcobinamide kinase /adenosylcobinamide-phosphate guanylyltransferase [Thermanaeromonas toyohensis ToBE]